MKMAILVFIALGLLGLPACGGGGGGQQLHFDGYDISERDYRSEVRSALLAGAVGVCGLIEESTPEELVESLFAGTPTPEETIPAKASAIPGQQDDPAALLRAATILQEECARVSH
jgi:hypothetical protein